MRLQFQERPWDLYGVVGYALVMAPVLLVFGGHFVAILLLLFAPGYVLVAALFPGPFSEKKPEIDWIERIALSFGLSIAIVPLLGLLLNFTPWGIRLVPIVTTITMFTVGMGCVAYWRRMRLPKEQRLSLTVDVGVPEWHGYTMFDKGLTIVLATSIAVAGCTLAYVVLTQRPGETFTEFYLLGPGGNASGYPTALNVSQAGTVIVGIANHESQTVNYAVRVDLVGVKIVYNATSRYNETVEVNRTTWSTFNVTLSNGQTWTQPYTFRINDTGLWKVEFLLFKDGDLSNAYQGLHLYLRVT